MTTDRDAAEAVVGGGRDGVDGVGNRSVPALSPLPGIKLRSEVFESLGQAPADRMQYTFFAFDSFCSVGLALFPGIDDSPD